MDISGLTLSDRTTDLLYADFDSLTKFPKELPDSFRPDKILESGKDPGLGIRALHLKGITGKGVSIAIIDQPLLVGHKEYSSSLKSYEELFLRVKNSPAAMHGAAVASLAVGKTCGVAPGADPDSRGAYGPGLFWRKRFFGGDKWGSKTTLLVPMDSRTTASPTGDGDYVFYRQGGLSWSTPYIAGLYALACQLAPEITPEAFFKKALETSSSETIKHGGKEFRLKRIVDPARLLESKYY